MNKGWRWSDDTGFITARAERSAKSSDEWTVEVDGEHLGCYMTEAQAMAAVDAAVTPAVIAGPRPSVMYRPKIMIDGDHWYALYGDNIEVGVVGFGKSPAEAMLEFDKAWSKPLPTLKGATP